MYRNQKLVAHLVFVFGDVGVDLVQRGHAVELAEVQAGLLRQVGTHVLIADGRHAGDIRVIPAGETRCERCKLDCLAGRWKHQKKIPQSDVSTASHMVPSSLRTGALLSINT